MALIKCPECSKEISDHAPACPHCGYPLSERLPDSIKTQKESKNGSAPHADSIPESCPKCGSRNITKLALHRKKERKNQSSGCLGCLLVIIIFLIAPWFLGVLGMGFLVGIGSLGEFIYENSGTMMILGIIGLIICGIYNYSLSKTYICEKCGTKFK